MSIPTKIHITYGSESGNAHALAVELQKKLKEFSPSLDTIDSLSLFSMVDWNTEQDLLLVVTSTTGNGEAPYNASNFYQALIQKRMKQRMKVDKDFINCQFSVFGIGDVKYENFCGFSKVIDGLLDKTGGTQLANRVDADIDYEDFFITWSDALLSYLQEKSESLAQLQSLTLQIDPSE